MRNRNQRAIKQGARIQAEGYACLDDRPDWDEVLVQQMLEFVWIAGDFPGGHFPQGPEDVPRLFQEAARRWWKFAREKRK